MKAFKSMGIDNEPFKATGVCEKDYDVIKIFFDENYAAMKFSALMKEKRVLESLGFYGDSTFSIYGPFFVKSVHDKVVTLIKG